MLTGTGRAPTLSAEQSGGSKGSKGIKGPTTAPRWPTGAGRILTAAVGLGCFVALFAIYMAGSLHSYGGTSDKATVILQGQAMLHGNVLLHGWLLPLDSYWTSDTVISALTVGLFGLGPFIIHLEPSLMSAAFGCIGLFVAVSGPGRRSPGALAAVTGTLLVLIAFPAPMLEYFLLSNAIHLGTAMYALIAFLALRRAAFSRWWVVAVVCLALGMLGDLDIIPYGILPIIAAGLLAALRSRRWRAALPHLGAALSGVALAGAVRLLALEFGTFGLTPGNKLVHAAGIPLSFEKLATVAEDMFFGTRNFQGLTITTPLQFVHVIGAAAVAVALACAICATVVGAVRGRSVRWQAADRSLPQPWALDDMLLLGVLGGAGAFLLQAVAGVEQARYLLVSTLFACILCARLAGRAWPAISGRVRLASAVVAAAVLLSFGAGFGLQLARPIVKGSNAPLVSWLQSHHLERGVGDYWSASMTTVQSGGKVLVAPVNEFHGKLVRMWNSPSDWYDKNFQFLAFRKPIWAGVDYADAVKAFGKPAHIYSFDGWSVLVWSRPIHVPLY